jgi:DNA-binding protein YbaB
MMKSPIQSLLALLLLLLLSSSFAFQHQAQSFPQRPVVSKLDLFARWGGGGSSDNNNNNADSNNSGGVEQVMQSMQSFKTNQKLGSLTGGLVQELASLTVEGRSEDGKIRVVMNGQQYPVACQVMDDVDMATLNSALMQAMQDAHAKSFSLMESKMKSLYDELGLSPMKK